MSTRESQIPILEETARTVYELNWGSTTGTELGFDLWDRCKTELLGKDWTWLI